MTPNSSVQVLYNIPTVSFAIHTAYLLSPSFLSQLPTADAIIAEALNPSRSLFQRAIAQAILARSKPIFDRDGDRRPRP